MGIFSLVVVRLFVCDIHQISGVELYGVQTSVMKKMPISSVYCKRRMEPHGARTSQIPHVQSSKFELVINAQTARMLALTVPPTLLATADEVID